MNKIGLLTQCVGILGIAGMAGCGSEPNVSEANAPVTPDVISAAVTPTVAPAGTSGNNFSATLLSGEVVEGTSVIGETIPAQSATATSPSGTTIQVRHGFFPGNQISAPAGRG